MTTVRQMMAVLMLMLSALVVAPALAQTQIGPGPHIRASIVAETPTPRPGGTTDIAIRMVPDPTWHGYWKNGGDAGFGMQIEWTVPPGVSIGDLQYPVPTTLVIAGLMNHVYERPYALIAPVTLSAGLRPGTRLPIRGEATWLACTDQVCVPETGTFALDLVVGDKLIVETRAGADLGNMRDFEALIAIGPDRGLSFTANASYVPPPPDLPYPDQSGSFDLTLFLTALFGAIVGGLILNIMPCVFPILSLKALALARAGGSASEARSEGIAYTAGAIFTALALGAALLLLRAGGEVVGWAFQLQSPPSVVLLTVLTATITANLAGLFEFGTLSFSAGRASREAPAPASPAKAAFATGALAAFVATPCSGPFLGAALGATLVLPAWAALPIFGGLGLGLALPFLLLALIPALRARLPKPGPWMVTMRRWLAIPMALTVLALVWLLGRQVGLDGWLVGATIALATVALGWWAGREQRGGRHPGPAFIAMAALILPAAAALPDSVARDATAAEAGLLGAERWSPERLAAARASGKPLFVYFTADWCVSCKVNEASSIERDETAAAFRAAGVRTLVADWTNADPAITRELATHGRNSVPLYLWYPAGGGEPEILPQVLTPSMLVERAGR